MGKAPSGSLPERVYASGGAIQRGIPLGGPYLEVLTRVANTGIVHLNADFVSLGRSDLNCLDAKWFRGLPSNGSLASDGLNKSQSAGARFDRDKQNRFG